MEQVNIWETNINNFERIDNEVCSLLNENKENTDNTCILLDNFLKK